MNRAEQGREQAEAPWRGSQEIGLQTREQRDYRRKVDISERGVPAGIDVVELVGVEAEVAVSGEMHDKDDHRRAPVEKRRHKRRRLSGAGVFHLESPVLISKTAPSYT